MSTVPPPVHTTSSPCRLARAGRPLSGGTKVSWEGWSGCPDTGNGPSESIDAAVALRALAQPLLWRIAGGSWASASIAARRCELATLTIRQLDERTLAWLRGRAAQHGRSVEAEVRAILDAAVLLPEQNFLLALHASAAREGGVDLEVPPRTDQPRQADKP